MADVFTSEGLLRQEITEDEGLRLNAYLDTKGIKTVGIGHNLERPQTPEEERLLLGIDNNRETVTEGEAKALLGIHLEHTREFFDKKIPWWRDMPEPARRAFENMAMMGTGSFTGFDRMISAAQRGDWAQAEQEALDSKWARDDVQPTRVQRIRSLFQAAELARMRPPRRGAQPARPQMGAGGGGGRINYAL